MDILVALSIVVGTATGSYLRIDAPSHRISEISRNRQAGWSVAAAAAAVVIFAVFTGAVIVARFG